MKIWSYIKNNNVLYIIESDCGRQNNSPPQNVHILILGTCDYVTLYSKGNLAYVITLYILICKDHPRLTYNGRIQ